MSRLILVALDTLKHHACFASLANIPLVCANRSEALVVKGVPLHPVAGAGMQAEPFQGSACTGVPDPHRALSGGGGYSVAVGAPGHAVYSAGLSGQGHLSLWFRLVVVRDVLAEWESVILCPSWCCWILSL